MRTLKYALLGLIDREPITGYDIVKEFESRVMANFWYAKHSQVYPELKRLTDEGFVEFKVILQGEKMEKKLYSITPKGHAEFVNWMKKDEPIGVTPKDLFRLRSYFTDFLPAEDYLKLLKSQLRMHTERGNTLKRSLESYAGTVPPYGTKEYGDYSVLLGAVMREDYYVSWLNVCIENLNKQTGLE
ncbi:MAG: PadR family transcriptional regulator [Lachnospiraceae bacterium]|nr:PadR family transcriptional regulator [Lachnospiraceae bacterium]